MPSKTPKFDKALDEYFSKLELDEKGGQWRTCRFSGEKFYVRPEDIVFYKKIRVPLPTLSPRERIRRKLAFLNTYNLFYGTSASSGKEIITQYPPETPYRIYEHQIWFGEDLDFREYARDFDSSKSFFEQFKTIQFKVPRPSLQVDATSVSSDYTNNSSYLKNCYLVFDSYQAEESAYSIALMNSKNCYDSFTAINTDIGYDIFESSDLYNCFFIEYSKNCLDSYFLYDCRNCTHCFGGVNLRHKKYVFFNEQLTKEEYEKRIKAINLGNKDILGHWKDEFNKLKGTALHKETHNERAISSLGEYLKNTKNCYASFYMVGAENTSYSIGGIGTKDSFDILGGADSEFSYDSFGGINNYNIKFSLNSDFSRELEYCDLCINCHNCFGCVGLKNKSFCIFNKQYEENEYWEMVDKVKIKMLKDGEYGEFFPPALSPYFYNISIATSYAGYDDIETAKKYGYFVSEIPDLTLKTGGEVIRSDNLPKNIADVNDNIIEAIILDSKNNKKFRYVRQEIDFYRKHNLALPREHFSFRLAEKRKRFGSILLSLYDRNCMKCGKKILSSYNPDDSRIVYCEPCYLKEIV